MSDWDNVEDAFKDLEKKEFSFFSSALASYRDSLLSQDFTRKEAMKLVEAYAKFIYDMSIEEFLRKKTDEDDDLNDIDEI